jgi:hypothetical protein
VPSYEVINELESLELESKTSWLDETSFVEETSNEDAFSALEKDEFSSLELSSSSGNLLIAQETNNKGNIVIKINFFILLPIYKKINFYD